jgi:hypothetical protein
MESTFNFFNGFILIVITIAVIYLAIEKRKTKTNSSVLDSAITSKKSNYEINYAQDFLDFDKIYNNMIIRNNACTFTMVIGCSGINFDLMSDNEKMMIEEVFIELLNFIRFPIQIYVQTQKVDLKDSLKTYQEKITSIEKEIKYLIQQFSAAQNSKEENSDHLNILAYEIQRKENLLDYATDLKRHIENMSTNKNVIQYKYHIILTYSIDELGLMNKFTEQEIYRYAYEELSSRAQSVIGALFGCGIKAEVLDSNALAELLYNAFNRDDAEKFRLKDNMEQGFYHLYATTENALAFQQSMDEPESDEKLLLLPDGFNVDLDRLSEELLQEAAATKDGRN